MKLTANSTEKLIRPFDVAYRLGYTVGRVEKWGREGTIPGAVVIDGKHIRFDSDVVEDFIRSGGNRTLQIASLTKAQRKRADKAAGAVAGAIESARDRRRQPAKGLRFDRNRLGPLSKYREPRVGGVKFLAGIAPEVRKDEAGEVISVALVVAEDSRDFVEDHYDKHTSGNWKSIRAQRQDVDRSTDTYELNVPVDGSPEVNVRFLDLLEAKHARRQAIHPERADDILAGDVDLSGRTPGELITKQKR